MATSPSRFECEPHYDDSHTLRIKAVCVKCGASHTGNADEIVNWESEHRCAADAVAA